MQELPKMSSPMTQLKNWRKGT